EDDIKSFMFVKFPAARTTDDRIRVNQIMSAGGPAVQAAAQAALDGDDTDMREFLGRGQEVARARDQEVATLSQLVQRATDAQRLAAEQTDAPKAASQQAVQAAQLAKEA